MACEISIYIIVPCCKRGLAELNSHLCRAIVQIEWLLVLLLLISELRLLKLLLLVYIICLCICILIVGWIVRVAVVSRMAV